MSASPMLASELTAASIWRIKPVAPCMTVIAVCSRWHNTLFRLSLLQLQNSASRVLTKHCRAKRMLVYLQAATWVRRSAHGSRGRSRRRKRQRKRRQPRRTMSPRWHRLVASAAGLQAATLLTTLTAMMGSWPLRSRCMLI